MELTSYILLGLLALLALALALLSAPLKLSLHLERDKNNSILRCGPFTVFDSSATALIEKKQRTEAESPEAESPEVNAEPEKPRHSFAEYTDLARQTLRLTPRILSALFQLGYRIVKKAKIEKLEGFLGGGLDDPALTGELAGYGYALIGALPVRHCKNIRIEPDYMGERLEYRIDAVVSFRPISALAPTMRFLYELPKRRIYQLIKTYRLKTEV